MSNKKQSSVDFIFNAFNLLSDADFKAWMLNNHDAIKAMHKEETIKSNRDGVDMVVDKKPYVTGEQYYKETFGGQDNE